MTTAVFLIIGCSPCGSEWCTPSCRLLPSLIHCTGNRSEGDPYWCKSRLEFTLIKQRKTFIVKGLCLAAREDGGVSTHQPQLSLSAFSILILTFATCCALLQYGTLQLRLMETTSIFCLFVALKNNGLHRRLSAFNRSSSPLTSLVAVTSSGKAPVMLEAQCPWQRCHANSNHVPCLVTKQLSAPGGLSQQLTRNKHLLCCSCYVRGRGGVEEVVCGGGGGGDGGEADGRRRLR